MFSKNSLFPALLAFVLALLATGLVANLRAGEKDALAAAKGPTAHPAAAEQTTVVSEQEGIMLFLGTPLRPGDKVPEKRIGSAKMDGKLIWYRKLRIGDAIEEGQILGRLEDRLSHLDADTKEAKVAAALTDQQAAEALCFEARERYGVQERLINSGRFCGGLDDLRFAKMAYDRCNTDVRNKEQAVVVARLELKQARAVLDSYEIRSRVRGIIKAIHKHPGEAVRKLETVFVIELPEGEER